MMNNSNLEHASAPTLERAPEETGKRPFKDGAPKVLVSGAHGLIGSRLVSHLAGQGVRTIRLVRERAGNREDVLWNPARGMIDRERLEGFDAVVHLAGESVATGRWIRRKKDRIRKSRVEGTRILCDALAGLDTPPKILVCASAVGIYGDRGDETLTESSSLGYDFLARVCREWELAANRFRVMGSRIVNLRFGVVLSPSGGALKKMLPAFRMGLGGPIGNGRQYMSWVALDDAVEAIQFALTNASVTGPVNVTSPNPVTNEEFSHELCGALGRTARLRMPVLAARLVFGEMAEALLLAGQRALPMRLLENGFSFKHPELKEALKHLVL